jgi:hypothetical protein
MRHLGKQICGSLALATSVATFGCAAGGAPGDVQPAVAPSLEAHAIYTRFVEASGGRAALERYSSSHATGQFSLPAQGIGGDLEVFAAAPNRMFVRVDIPGFGMVRNGYDGEVGWSINPAVGPMVLEGRMLDQLRQQADFLGPLNVEAYVDSATVVEETEFDGRPCLKVRVVTKWGEEYVEFYDVETGLLAGNIRTQESPMGPVETTTVLSGYQDFGGIQVPTKTVQQMMGMEQIITVTAVEFDTVDPSVFALPDEIGALISK